MNLNGATDLVLRHSDLEIMAYQTAQLNKIGQELTIICGYNQVSKCISSMMLPLDQLANFTFYICESENHLQNIIKSL